MTVVNMNVRMDESPTQLLKHVCLIPIICNDGLGKGYNENALLPLHCETDEGVCAHPFHHSSLRIRQLADVAIPSITRHCETAFAAVVAIP